MDETVLPVFATGGNRFDNGAIYVGSWNKNGQMHGEGQLLLPDGTKYDGCFEEGLYNGLGVLTFSDSSRYEGEFYQGWFHGYGVFWRSDTTRHEGLTTFSDNTHGFPRNEGFFQECNLKRRKNCPDVVQKAQKVAFMARKKFVPN
ncbi:MORN repeat-containing protein 4 homolog isoform X2 [Sitophilus oryzae]|uniref:MORN repeat-containing protein 4 homolog isoform X2 n=1 Tax=Sitophilus oryzae TaxID=7048 RepID=A0A6J2XBQ5_SITOR|nr:MORN repeat-containing protein 4 homolog isoform X2 [Sitophilus oryzae]